MIEREKFYCLFAFSLFLLLSLQHSIFLNFRDSIEVFEIILFAS